MVLLTNESGDGEVPLAGGFWGSQGALKKGTPYIPLIYPTTNQGLIHQNPLKEVSLNPKP